MDWMAIGGAIVLGAMFFFLLPRAKEMLKNSPEASNSEWMSALIPLGLVGLFVLWMIAAL